MAAAAHSHSCTPELENAQYNQPFSSRREPEKFEAFFVGRGRHSGGLVQNQHGRYQPFSRAFSLFLQASMTLRS